jgi:hypothetical protein
LAAAYRSRLIPQILAILPIRTKRGITVSSKKVATVQASETREANAAGQLFRIVRPIMPTTVMAMATGTRIIIKTRSRIRPIQPRRTGAID